MKKTANKLLKGLNIFYYGKGKGKTTAVMGLAVRAAGAGMDVYILQFVKAKAPKPGEHRQSGEWPISNEFNYFDAAKKSSGDQSNGVYIGKIDYEQAGLGFVGVLGDKKDREQHIQAAKDALKKSEQIILSEKYELIILDELVSALELDLITEQDILDLLGKKPKHISLAYTGHDPYEKIIEASDLVSEINMIKHPYYQGILAQRGIDF